MRKRFIQFFGSLIPVALGVYLAVAVDDCKATRALQERLDRVDEVLREEILSNRQAVRTNLTYHVALRDSFLQSMHGLDEAALETRSARQVFRFWRGTRMQGLQHGGYQAALASGTLTEMPITQLTDLSNLYNRQENYRGLGTQALRSVTQLSPRSTLSEGAAFIGSFTVDAYYAETELLKVMDRVLENLGVPVDTSYQPPPIRWRHDD